MTKDTQSLMKERFDGLIENLMGAGFFLEQAVEILERGMIESALRLKKGNQCEAAKVLGIHRNTLQRKMVQHRIDGKRPRRKTVASAGAASSVRRSRKAS